MNRLEGWVAFLVGGGAGIAKACALMFAKEGAKVIVADINPATGRASADAVLAQGGEAIFVKMDATIEASVKGTMLACRHERAPRRGAARGSLIHAVVRRSYFFFAAAAARSRNTMFCPM